MSTLDTILVSEDKYGVIIIEGASEEFVPKLCVKWAFFVMVIVVMKVFPPLLLWKILGPHSFCVLTQWTIGVPRTVTSSG